MPSPFGEKVFGINKLPLLQVTNTVTLSLLVQPEAFLTCTEYVTVCLGIACGFGQLRQFNWYSGVHFQLITSCDPVACNCPGVPATIVILFPASTDGTGFTVT